MLARSQARIKSLFRGAASESLPLRKLSGFRRAISEALKFLSHQLPSWEFGPDLTTPCTQALVLVAATPDIPSNCQYIRDFCRLPFLDPQFCHVLPMLHLYGS
jgi:hypothetical protein